jgi:uncharacterized protein
MYFEVQVDDLPRAVNFYREVFGWDVQKVEADLPVEYWRIDAPGLSGGLLPRPAPAPAPEQGTNAFVCSFEVDDFDGAETRIRDLGGQVALPKFPVPGQRWQGYFLDTEGNTFGVFEVDDTAR